MNCPECDAFMRSNICACGFEKPIFNMLTNQNRPIRDLGWAQSSEEIERSRAAMMAARKKLEEKWGKDF